MIAARLWPASFLENFRNNSAASTLMLITTAAESQTRAAHLLVLNLPFAIIVIEFGSIVNPFDQ